MTVIDQTLRGLGLRIEEATNPGERPELAYSFVNNANQAWTLARIKGLAPAGFGGQLVVETNAGSGVPDDITIERLRIDQNGYVGIGTNAPTQKLDVNGAVKAAAFQGDGSGLTNVRDATRVARAGDTMTGALNLPANGLSVGGNQLVVSGGNVGVGAGLTWANGTSKLSADQGGSIELGNSLAAGTVPYIDFHFGVGSAQDFNMRIINNANRQLLITGGNVRMDGDLTVAGHLSFGGDLTWANGNSRLSRDQGGSIELGNSLAAGTIPYIDFHYGVGAAQDFNMRIINNANRQLLITGGNVRMDGELTVAGNTTVGAVIVGAARFFGDQGGSLELGNSLSPGVTPYIDFHYGVGSAQDFNMRIINNASRQLLITGGNVRVEGVLTHNSSRESKEDISMLDAEEALQLLDQLDPVHFTFKADPDRESHIGFIAEDVPPRVATSDRKSINLMTIVGILTRVVKQQQQMLAGLGAHQRPVRIM